MGELLWSPLQLLPWTRRNFFGYTFYCKRPFSPYAEEQFYCYFLYLFGSGLFLFICRLCFCQIRIPCKKNVVLDNYGHHDDPITSDNHSCLYLDHKNRFSGFVNRINTASDPQRIWCISHEAILFANSFWNGGSCHHWWGEPVENILENLLSSRNSGYGRSWNSLF